MSKTNKNPNVIETGTAKPDCAPLGLLCLTVQETTIIRKLLGDLPQSKVWAELPTADYHHFCGSLWPQIMSHSTAEVRHNSELTHE